MDVNRFIEPEDEVIEDPSAAEDLLNELVDAYTIQEVEEDDNEPEPIEIKASEALVACQTLLTWCHQHSDSDFDLYSKLVVEERSIIR